jgi:5'(3')-deoxyribonucleotidase
MKKLFFDMDNTLAIFSQNREHEKNVVLEKMYEKGFFAGLEPMPNARFTIEKLQERGNRIYIVSACIESPYVEQEKRLWLREHLPTIKEEDTFFLPVGESKTELIKSLFSNEKINKQFVLIDDYEKNLVPFKLAGGTTIKKVRDFTQYNTDFDYCVANLLDLLNIL